MAELSQSISGLRAVKKYLFSRVVEELGQPEGRVGEIERPIGPVNQVVGAVEPLSLVAVGKNGQRSVRLEAGHAAVAVLVDRQPALRIERQAVGSGLAVLGNVASGIPARLAKHRELSVLSVLVDGIGVWVAEQQAITHPDRTL